jgi:hypothetical protein
LRRRTFGNARTHKPLKNMGPSCERSWGLLRAEFPMASHPEAAWYLNKAEEWDRLAKEAATIELRARYETEARLWREIAADIANERR